MSQVLIEILIKVKARITDDSDLVWTRYSTPRELRNELDNLIAKAERGEKNYLEEINFHFLPTSTLQEHSLANGWSAEYIKLAAKFDELYARLKNDK